MDAAPGSTLLETLPIAAWLQSPAGEIELVNSFFRDSLDGREGSAALALIHGDDWDRFMQLLRCERGRMTCELRLRARGGGHRVHLVRATSRLGRVLVTACDIDDQYRAREALGRIEAQSKLAEEARSAAETQNRAKDEFLAILGHELRNPLAPILTALQLMELRGSDATRKEREVIGRQVKHLVRLVDDLLDVSRITRGKVQLRLERIEISDVVAKAVEVASPLLEARSQHLALEVPASGYAVWGDPMRLSQVVSNLLTNAAKYTPVDGHVYVSAEKTDHEVVLRVIDDGSGISKEMLPRIFDSFAQERQSLDRAPGGLGLGLTIVRNLVALHGGRVIAHSDGPGRGTELRVHLPLAERRRKPRPREPLVARMQNAPRKPLRVLVVDDNQDAATMFVDWLAEHGYEVRVAHDGPSALRVAEALSPDVVLLDIGLPIMDGYEVARRLRSSPRDPRSTLIAVTGYGHEKSREHAVHAGFDEYFVKPVNLVELAKALERETKRRTMPAPRS